MTALERLRHRLTHDALEAYEQATDSACNEGFRARRLADARGLVSALKLLDEKACWHCGWKKPRRPRRKARRAS